MLEGVMITIAVLAVPVGITVLYINRIRKQVEAFETEQLVLAQQRREEIILAQTKIARMPPETKGFTPVAVVPMVTLRSPTQEMKDWDSSKE